VIRATVILAAASASDKIIATVLVWLACFVVQDAVRRRRRR
jgi:hypothetical protein